MEGEADILDVDRLAAVAAGRIKVNGITHDVFKAKGRTVQSIRAAQPGEAEDRMRDAVRKSVPTLTDDELIDLDQNQLAAIFGMATAGIKAVEAMFPNVFGPDKVPTSPG